MYTQRPAFDQEGIPGYPQAPYSGQGYPQQSQQAYPNYPQQQSTSNNNNQFNNDFLRTMTPMAALGGKMFEERTSSWFSSFTVIWNSLKLYFAVNNSYVLRKLLVILFPFSNKSWSRLAADEAAVSQIQVVTGMLLSFYLCSTLIIYIAVYSYYTCYPSSPPTSSPCLAMISTLQIYTSH